MKSRVLGLDILRTIAILLVCLLHGREILVKYYPSFPEIWFIDGVDLFFVLSGFLIGTIFIKEFAFKNEIRINQIVGFWKRRWFRTLPLYFLILFLNICFFYIENRHFKIQGIWKYFFFLQNFTLVECYHFFTESWSLAIEEWFYLVLPMLVFVISFFIKGNVKYAILYSCIIILVCSIFARNIYGLSLPKLSIGDWIKHLRNVVVFRMDSILYGVLGAYISIYNTKFWTKYKVHLFVLGIIGIFSNYYFNKLETNLQMVNTDIVASASILFLLPLVSTVNASKSALLNGFFTFISKISYSMYLINFSLVLKYLNKFSPSNSPSIAIVNYLLFWFFTITVSYILYTFFERPTTALRDKY